MTTKKITNTLNRWHKIAERIKVAAAEIKARNEEALDAGRNLDDETFAVSKARMEANAERAVTEGNELRTALHTTLFDIRRAVARANVQHEVTDLLNYQEQNKQDITYYEGQLAHLNEAVTVAEYEEMAKIRARTTSKNGYHSSLHANVTFLRPERIAHLRDTLAALVRERNGLADRLADANASKITLNVSATVADYIGLSE